MLIQLIKGSRVELVPAALEDKERVYEWCFHSEITKSHAGPPDFPDVPISTWEEFFEGVGGYSDYYFTGTEPEHGRGYIIRHNGEDVGSISYSSFHLRPNMAELDIWMNSEANCGKGFGNEAIVLLSDHLNRTLGVVTLIMRPSIRNLRANRAYEKAEFTQSDKRPEDYLLDEYISVFGEGDYGEDESALLIKHYDKKNLFELPKLPLSEELVTVLAKSSHVRIERIVSAGQVSDWYDQSEAEFVALLEGSAIIEYDNGKKPVGLEKGDTLLIPAHERHRVSYTSGDPACVWLCVFMGG